MSQYRATRNNFLPPAPVHIIRKSTNKWVDFESNQWLFDKDWVVDRPQRFKQWALFDSDQWDPASLIVYVTGPTLPRVGETFALFRGNLVYNFKVLSKYPTKRKSTTYILREEV
jgi:hypothetical protein